VLRKALTAAIIDAGRDVQPFGADGPRVNAVDVQLVKAEYFTAYPAVGDTEEKRNEAKRKAFTRHVEKAAARDLIASRQINGMQIVWVAQ
jgi:hypothetical protein